MSSEGRHILRLTHSLLVVVVVSAGSLFDFIHSPACSLGDVDHIQTLCEASRTEVDPCAQLFRRHSDGALFEQAYANHVSFSLQPVDRGRVE